MPYKENYVFEKPNNIQQKIWRFIDREQYIDFLNRRALYFPRLDLLGDRWEGKKTKPEIIRTQQYRKHWAKQAYLNKQDQKKILRVFSKLDSETHKNLLQHIFVSCWHMYDQDSVDMWNIHSKDKKNIVIQSTYLRLMESINDSKEVYIGKVKYRDTDIDLSPIDNFFRYPVRKQKKFEKERELRAVVINWIDEKGNVLKKPLDNGLSVSVDINLLVESVLVSSSSSSLFLDDIRSITANYGLLKRVERSLVSKSN